MKNVFWLIGNQLAGRCGPDLAPWNVRELRSGGIDAVLSVNAGFRCDPNEFSATGIDYACIPMPANEPPIATDTALCIDALPKTFAFMHERITQNKKVLVHCTAGKDRTGLAMAYYLMQVQGLTPGQALAKVRVVRPIALSALGWEAMGLQVLRDLYELDSA